MENQAENWPEKKTRIVQAIIALTARKGLDRTTTSRIAKSAGVGEGTIYRYFENKDILLDTAAVYASEQMFRKVRENYAADTTVYSQFIQFCHDFLNTDPAATDNHIFVEQYINSPNGIEYRKKTLRKIETDQDVKPLIYPINRILMQGLKQEVVKDLPIQLLVGLTLGPLGFTLKHAAQGFFELKEEYISEISQSCWASVRR